MHSSYIKWETSFKGCWRAICKQTLSALQPHVYFKVRWVAVNQWSLDILVLLSLGGITQQRVKVSFIRSTTAESETFLGNVHSIFFIGLVPKNCCFSGLTRHFVTCHLIVLHVEEIASFQGLLKTSYLQLLLFCILHTTPKRRLVQSNRV